MHGDITLGVCSWYWLFTILGECVVSSERPKFYSWLDMDPAMKVRESVGRHAKPAVRPRKFVTQINTQDWIN